MKVHKLPQGIAHCQRQSDRQRACSFRAGEKVQAILPVDEFSEDKYVVMLTEKGIIKKTGLDAFSNPRPSGIIALTTDLDDQVIDAKISNGKADIFIATREGMSIRFDEGDVRPWVVRLAA